MKLLMMIISRHVIIENNRDFFLLTKIRKYSNKLTINSNQLVLSIE